MQTLLTRQPPSFRSFILALVVCFVAMFINWRFPQVVQPMRDVLKTAYFPIYQMANYPVVSGDWLRLQVQSEQDLRRENTALRAELLQAQVRLQKFSELSAENTRLRGLMNTPLIVDGRVLIAEIVGVDANPLVHVVVINKGSNDHLQQGQTVLDDQGIMGQIISVYPNSARVMLLSDKDSSISVRIERTGMRAIVSGKGDYAELDMDYVPSSADVKVGDHIYSSGLGARYPAGYLVGTVSAIQRHHSGEFAQIMVKPAAQLASGHNVVVLFSQGLAEEQPNAAR
ncbi:rod shape-determining protein MreC [Acinetobacter qingfengensis]|uniref:Cell shape-determining protein MreC n=1 Tax=Acinetobacter qingfengensis TaxID=1262585 RepID=A0A1E7RG21_9GAMM|nr:rod shape-determining protein MreC [Acinetobacter qingfengensis]KAA8732709.1 rod shape-determining protein MreC [Acinetobacter qingfengensis]OEY98177.1 rod shape-determining protein MreC [Acinetobacter qingfengensis]